MRVLVEPSAHHLRNAGDVSMLVVAYERLRRLWPDAEIGVICDHAARLAANCPGAVLVPADGRRLWFDDPYLGGRVHYALPRRLAGGVRTAERSLRQRAPSAARAAVLLRRRLKGDSTEPLETYLDWVETAHVVVASGAGLLTDAFAPLAGTVLELLEAAIRRGAPAAMLGQGVGPVEDGALLTAMRRVLPRLDLVGLRERVVGAPILQALGVPDGRVAVTGDDAVELAYRERRDVPRDALGFGIRAARYAASEETLRSVAAVVRDAATRLGAQPLAVPISFHPKEDDAGVASRLLGVDSDPAPDDVVGVIRRIGRCRVVVTGSYHAAVFALSQGIPAVGIAASPYYEAKFDGLAEQFGGLCRRVRLDEGDVLARAIDDAWENADAWKPRLLADAEQQVEHGRFAYERLKRLVDSSREGTLVATVS